MAAVKPITPVRRSRPNTAGDSAPSEASMELLPPDPASSPSMRRPTSGPTETDYRRSQDPAKPLYSATTSSRPGSGSTAALRRTQSVRDKEADRVVRLSSTRHVDSTTQQGPPVGALLMQLPSQLSVPLYSSGYLNSQNQHPIVSMQTIFNQSFNHAGRHRYDSMTRSSHPVKDVPPLSIHNAASLSHSLQQQSSSKRLWTAESSTSMLLGDVPGPFPSKTPGVTSRAWTAQSHSLLHEDDDEDAGQLTERISLCTAVCAHEEGDGPDENSARQSANALHAMDENANGQPCQSAGICEGEDGVSDSMAAMLKHQTENAEFYKYLHSRRPTEQGTLQDGGDDDAFEVPRYSMSTTAASLDGPRAAALQRPGTGQPSAKPLSTAASVSGSGVFFTALKGTQAEAELQRQQSTISTRSAVPTDNLSYLSAYNPMKEPSAMSEACEPVEVGASNSMAEQHFNMDDDDGVCMGSGSDDGNAEMDEYVAAYDRDDDGSKSVWENPMQTPGGTAPPTAEPSRRSFAGLLHQLYDDTSDDQQQQKQQQEQDAVDLASTQTHAEHGDDEQEEDEEGVTGHEEVQDSGAAVRLQSRRIMNLDDQEDLEDMDADLDKSGMQAVEAGLVEQEGRRQELADYIMQLQGLRDESGSPLVELPRNYEVLVEKLLLAKRLEYSALEGWLGPRRFQDLPINSLPEQHEDPKIAEGLVKVRTLDMKLAEKEAEIMIMERERDPDRWAAREKARLHKQAAAVEVALKRERMKRMRKAKLERALIEGIDEDDMRGSMALSTASSRITAASTHRSVFQLRPDEEALVEAILKRKDEEDFENPFELTGDVCIPPEHMDPLIVSLSRPSSALLSYRSVAEQQRPGAQGLGSEASFSLLPPLALSAPLQGEASAADLLRKAHDLACELLGQASVLYSEPTQPRTTCSGGTQSGSEQVQQHGDASSPTQQAAAKVHAEGHQPAAGVSDPHGAPSHRDHVDLSLGLAIHTRALLRAQQVAVAGMPLSMIDAHLQRFAHEHNWTADGKLADFSFVKDPETHKHDGQSKVSVAAEPSHNARSKPSQQQQQHAGGPSVAKVKENDDSSNKKHQSEVNSSDQLPVKRDFIREEREAKELVQREADLDARIRAFKVSDPAGSPITPAIIAALVQECKILAQRAMEQQQTASTVAHTSAGDQETQGSSVPEQASTGEVDKETKKTERRASATNRLSSAGRTGNASKKLSTPSGQVGKASVTASVTASRRQEGPQPGSPANVRADALRAESSTCSSAGDERKTIDVTRSRDGASGIHTAGKLQAVAQSAGRATSASKIKVSLVPQHEMKMSE